jgi:hypothetical protein
MNQEGKYELSDVLSIVPFCNKGIDGDENDVGGDASQD